LEKYKECSDEQLFELIKLNNAEAYKVLYDRLFYILFSHALHKLRSKEDAQDLTQDLFMNIWNKREQININGQVINFLFASLRFAIVLLITISRQKNKMNVRSCIIISKPILKQQLNARFIKTNSRKLFKMK